MTSYVINPSELKNARDIGYNHARIEGGTFYMAGQVAMDADSKIVGNDIETQARKAFQNVGILLDTIDKDYGDIAKVTTHIVDPAKHYYDGYKQVYWDIFKKPYPCHTVLGHDQLANEDYLLEIEIEVPLSMADIEGIEADGETIREL